AVGRRPPVVGAFPNDLARDRDSRQDGGQDRQGRRTHEKSGHDCSLPKLVSNPQLRVRADAARARRPAGSRRGRTQGFHRSSSVATGARCGRIPARRRGNAASSAPELVRVSRQALDKASATSSPSQRLVGTWENTSNPKPREIASESIRIDGPAAALAARPGRGQPAFSDSWNRSKK